MKFRIYNKINKSVTRLLGYIKSISKKKDVSPLEIKSIAEILKKGMINSIHPNFGTPLHIAVRYGHNKTVIYLLEHGADITILDSSGKSPLDLAKLLGNKLVLDTLNYHELKLEKDKIFAKSLSHSSDSDNIYKLESVDIYDIPEKNLIAINGSNIHTKKFKNNEILFEDEGDWNAEIPEFPE